MCFLVVKYSFLWACRLTHRSALFSVSVCLFSLTQSCVFFTYNTRMWTQHKEQAARMASEGGPVSTKANVHDLASSVDLSGKRVFVRVRASLFGTTSALSFSSFFRSSIRHSPKDLRLRAVCICIFTVSRPIGCGALRAMFHYRDVLCRKCTGWIKSPAPAPLPPIAHSFLSSAIVKIYLHVSMLQLRTIQHESALRQLSTLNVSHVGVHDTLCVPNSGERKCNNGNCLRLAFEGPIIAFIYRCHRDDWAKPSFSFSRHCIRQQNKPSAVHYPLDGDLRTSSRALRSKVALLDAKT